MPDGIMGVLWAFCWGMSVASGALVGTMLGLMTHLGHRGIAAFMSVGAGVLLSAASFKVAFEALVLAGGLLTTAGMIAGGATFSLANAALVGAKERKRCGECKPQPSEAEVPGSGKSIALGTALDSLPEALVLGFTLRVGAPDLAIVGALTFANVPETLSGTAGMRLASRSPSYVLGVWAATAVGSAATTAIAFHFVSDLGPHTTAILKAYGAGALIAMTAETMIPEAFHNGPRFSGVLAAAGFAALMLLAEFAR